MGTYASILIENLTSCLQNVQIPSFLLNLTPNTENFQDPNTTESVSLLIEEDEVPPG